MDIDKNPSSTEMLSFMYQNTDSAGQSSIPQYQQIDGINDCNTNRLGRGFRWLDDLETTDPHITNRKKEYIYIPGDMSPQKFEKKITDLRHKIIVSNEYIDKRVILYVQYEKDGPWHKNSQESLEINIGRPFNNIRFYLDGKPCDVNEKGYRYGNNKLGHYWGDQIPGLWFV